LVDSLAPAPALDILGRCSRVAACAENAPAATGTGTATQLHLLNGELLNHKLSARSGHLQRSIELGKSNADIVQQFYLRALGRSATAEELASWEERLDSSAPEERARRLEDFVWSLLNSGQFISNH
jgi:hypothetical protein